MNDKNYKKVNAAPTGPEATAQGNALGAPPESPEVRTAREANAARKRADALTDAEKTIGIDLRNSCEQVASFVSHQNVPQIKSSFELLEERYKKGKQHLQDAEVLPKD